MPFSWAGVDGSVRVELGPNDDPAALGCAEFARGFPVCRATIEYPAEGYSNMLGWVQMLNSGYLARGEGYVCDGFEPFGPLPHPFSFFGVSPTFFDAPHTDNEDSDFRAYTFLCGLGGDLLEYRREVRAVLGFGWTFTKRGTEVKFSPPSALATEDWERQRGYLAQAFPDWTFAAGLCRHP